MDNIYQSSYTGEQIDEAVRRVLEGSSSECSGQHVIEVEELPDEGIKGATYQVNEKVLADIIIADSGVRPIFILYEILFEITPSVFYVRSLDEVTEPMSFPWGIYFVIPERMVYVYVEDENSEGNYTWIPLPEGPSPDGYEISYVITTKNVYYEWINDAFSDVIISFDGLTIPLSLLMNVSGVEYSFNTIPTKTTENVKVSTINGNSSDDIGMLHFYYIEDENDVFLYGYDEGTDTNDWYSLGVDLNSGTFNGCVVDADEVTVDGYYVLGGRPGWKKYSTPSGRISITNNNITVDVRDFSSAIVKIPEYTGRVVYA